MMKFHAAILTPNGDVTAKACRDGERQMHDSVNRRMMDEFRRLLSENLTDDPTQCGRFREQFVDIRHVFEWQQVEPFSAMCKFYVRTRKRGQVHLLPRVKEIRKRIRRCLDG
jgi:hypothetical protein